MAETEQTEQTDNTEQTNGTNGGNGSGDSTAKTVARAAAVAAATGATALAARKVLAGNAAKKEVSGDQKSSGNTGGVGGADTSLITTMASSAWDSARDVVVPMIEDASENAGAYVAQNSPEIVRDSVIPRFIRGFQKAQKSSQDDSE
jgi:hypothetical protein